LFAGLDLLELAALPLQPHVHITLHVNITLFQTSTSSSSSLEARARILAGHVGVRGSKLQHVTSPRQQHYIQPDHQRDNMSAHHNTANRPLSTDTATHSKVPASIYEWRQLNSLPNRLESTRESGYAFHKRAPPLFDVPAVSRTATSLPLDFSQTEDADPADFKDSTLPLSKIEPQQHVFAL
jgi:hypothetical protein